MDIKNMKVSIGIVIAIIAQAFGIIWYVAQLDSTVSNLDSTVATIQEQATSVDIAVLRTDVDNLKDEVDSDKFDSSDLEEAIDELEGRMDELGTRDAIMENEMRTIMSDHSGFNDVLRELNQSGLLPSGEKREYGNYGE